MSHPTFPQVIAIFAAVAAILLLVFTGAYYLSDPAMPPGDTGHPASPEVGR